MWLDSSPTERARLQKQYLLGDSKAVSDPHNHFESVLRVELLEQIPDFMAQACTRQAIFDSRASSCFAWKFGDDLSPSTRPPQAAAGEYEAEQWTAQEWEEYEAEVIKWG
eukprot:3705562-Amphidinium_carterae.1